MVHLPMFAFSYQHKKLHTMHFVLMIMLLPSITKETAMESNACASISKFTSMNDDNIFKSLLSIYNPESLRPS